MVNGIKSDWAPVVLGVPQGTVLGPLLFSLYINDISADIESEIRLFADDCVCYREIKNEEDTLKLQRDIDRLGSWARKWGMRFQPVKCNMMQLTNKRSSKIQAKPIVLQTLHKELAPILQLIYQGSLDSGKLPSIWKEANVSPIFKKGDKSDPANYRPISLTCVLCKVLEHIVASSISRHFTEQNILFDLQHGFREKRSCETQLIMLVDKLAKNMQAKKQTDLILLDFSKAFDKVAHEKLLLKLHIYGIRGNTLNWVKDFLDNRSQSVLLNGSNSDSILLVSSGVPQGSVLGAHTVPSIYK